MKLKDKLIRKLLDTGKKHRILVYPTLALVAVITAVSHAVYWGRGNGKKLLASVMIMVMLITQSLFLTSSADTTAPDTGSNASPTDSVSGDKDNVTLPDGSDEVLTNNFLDNSNLPEGEDINGENTSALGADLGTLASVDNIVVYFRIVNAENGVFATMQGVHPTEIITDELVVPYPSDEAVAAALFGADMSSQANYFDFKFYSDSTCSSELTRGANISYDSAVYEYNIYIKPTRTKYPISIVDSKEVLPAKDSVIDVDSAVPGVIYPAVTFEVGDASVNNEYRRGYTFFGYSYAGTTYTPGGSFSITPSNPNPIIVTSEWTAMQFAVNYDAVGADAPDVIRQAETEAGMEFVFSSETMNYGDSVTLPDTDKVKEMGLSNEAWYISGWKNEASGQTYLVGDPTLKSSSLTDDLNNVEDNPNVMGATLTAVWSYRDISLVTDSTGSDDAVVVESDGTNVTITGSYGDYISCIITADYLSASANGNEFTYTVSNTDMFSSLGLSVVASSGDYSQLSITGRLSDVTNGAASITLEIEDANKPGVKTPHTINLVSNKRKVSVDSDAVTSDLNSDKPSKDYDGNTRIGVCGMVPVKNAAKGDDTDAIAVAFEQYAELVEANAGENKDIYLTGVHLTGSKADMYELTGYDDVNNRTRVDGVATVRRRTVRVNVRHKSGQSDSILFGQDSPEFLIELSDPSELAEIDRANYPSADDEAAIASFMAKYIGHTGWKTERHIYSPASSDAYIVFPTFNFDGMNYRVEANNGAEFFVARDAAEEGVNYGFNKEKCSNGYYSSGTAIVPMGIYDHIRVIGAEGDVNTSWNRTEAMGYFSPQYEFTESCTDKEFTIQMMDFDTGAITAPITITVSVDLDPPVLERYSVSPNINTYFNNLSFGSYYRAQDIDGNKVESINVTVEYSSPDSECSYLYYYFADEDGSVRGSGIGKVNLVKNANGNYQAQFPIGTGTSGQLIVYAEDTTGNVSVKSQLRASIRDSESNLVDTEAVEYNGVPYYEWMVENKIEAAQIVVSDASGAEAVEGKWYNCLNFNVNAADADSGLNKVIWSVTDPDGNTGIITEEAGSNIAGIRNVTSYGKVLAYVFGYEIGGEDAAVGEYSVSGVLYDNAGNSIGLEQVGPYMLDCKAPVVEYEKPPLSGYHSGITFKFTVTEGEDESGIDSVKLYKDNVSDENLISTWGDNGSYEYEITINGDYIIVAADKAGNVTTTENITFAGISDVEPSTPVIRIDTGSAEIGKDGWYINGKPDVTIISDAQTSDGIPADTYYRITVGNKTTERIADREEYTFSLENEGIILIEAWSISASNCKSKVATKTVKVDMEAPVVSITGSTADGNGEMIVSFKATDSVSGVDGNRVTINDKQVDVTSENGAVKGSFRTDGSDSYSIVVEDIAGNVSETVEFRPLGLYATPITKVTSTGAYIEANVYEGTNPITECYIEYKKASDKTYETCLYNKSTVDYGIKMIHTFRNLTPDTEYNFRVYASTAIEEKVITGSFRTSGNASKAAIYGNVAYDGSLPEGLKTYPIFINLYSANTVLAGVEIKDADSMNYTLKNVADGNYRIVATNGLLTQETKVIVKNGGIEYPTDYASKGGINFVLSGLSTSVEIEDDEICITADGLDKIYNTSLYNGNVTDEDLEVVRNGGTIEIVLHASYIKVSDVSQTVQSVFADKIGTNAVIERYIQLYIVKEVKDASGRYVNGTPSNIVRLAEPISISFPLGELSGQKIYVASLHGENSNYSFMNWNKDSNIAISDSFVTIQTDRFSVYALYRLLDAPKSYTVKWIDGDGRVMKTETVQEGKAATPPVETPTKTETEKYTYKFKGWDTDYSCITKDTVIAAWFTAVAKDKQDNNNGNSGNGSTSDTGNGGSDEISTSDKPYTYMGSADSPRTGDEAPIAVAVVVMLLAASGAIVLRRKVRK